jgi:hypothetical protein
MLVDDVKWKIVKLLAQNSSPESIQNLTTK